MKKLIFAGLALAAGVALLQVAAPPSVLRAAEAVDDDDGMQDVDGKACKKLADQSKKRFRGLWMKLPREGMVGSQQ